jgi:hypothetical protein
MKYIAFAKHGQWDTRSVLKQVMNIAPRGMLLDEMRQRIKVMDMLDEAARTEIGLDEDQFKLVAAAVKAFPFNVAHRDLLAVIDGILDAPSAPSVKANGKAEAEAHAS